MKIYEKPKCKCGENAICLNAGLWLCGRCLEQLYKKLNSVKEKLLYG